MLLPLKENVTNSSDVTYYKKRESSICHWPYGLDNGIHRLTEIAELGESFHLQRKKALP